MFDSLEELIKARKAKGLEKWGKLQKVTSKLSGKQATHISFTCCHPKHSGTDTHNIGSIEGNLHFLLGYVNPGFFLAPYHWNIIYPDLEDTEIQEVTHGRKHPAQPVLWEASGAEVVEEGDLEEGAPHPYAYTARKTAEVKKRSIKATTPYGTYEADPVEGVVYYKEGNKVFKWEVVQDSYFAATNPEITAAMEEALAVKEEAQDTNIPEVVKHLAIPMDWDPSVYPFVKSMFPVPGSVFTVSLEQETVYGLIKSDQIVFVDAVGQPVQFTVFDEPASTLGLTQATGHPAVIHEFGKHYLHVSGDHLISKAQDTPAEDRLPSVLAGFPTQGFEHVPANYTESLTKSVVSNKDHTQLLVIERS